MRLFSILMLAGVLASCGGYRPVSFSEPIEAAQPLQCAREEMEERGYEVASAETTSGTVTGHQINEQPWYKRILGFRSTADQISASVNAGNLQVTAISSDPTDASEGGRADTGLGATRDAERDALGIISECSE